MISPSLVSHSYSKEESPLGRTSSPAKRSRTCRGASIYGLEGVRGLAAKGTKGANMKFLPKGVPFPTTIS